MSFGISISDIICLANLAKQTYTNCTEACAKHATITAEIRSLRSVLRRVRNEATRSTTLLEQSPHGKELMDTIEECTRVLNQINRMLQKHSSLSTKWPTLWDRLGFATKNFGELRRQLSAHQKTITLLILSTTSSAARNIDAKLDTVVDEFPQIQRAINSLLAETRSKAGSVWTAYSDDDPYTWRQIRRDLNMAGFPSKTVRKYRRQIESHIRSLELESSPNL
jgi:DNA-binding MarR family transcriptional regulator